MNWREKNDEESFFRFSEKVVSKDKKDELRKDES